MKRTIALVALVLSITCAHAQTAQCLQTQFWGEANQQQAFNKDLGDGIEFSVLPRQVEVKGTVWSFFALHVLGEMNKDGMIFVFRPSDANWALATTGYPAYVGGVGSDLRAALGYRSRYLLVPLSKQDLQQLREAASRFALRNTPQQDQQALAALQAAHLAHLEFEITDYGLGAGEPPTTVDWVKFKVKLTVPVDFPFVGSTALIECPAIPAEVVEDLKNPKRHFYPLPGKENLALRYTPSF